MYVQPAPGLTAVRDPRNPLLFFTAAGAYVPDGDIEIERLIEIGDLVIVGTGGGEGGTGGGAGGQLVLPAAMQVGLFTAFSSITIPFGTDVVRTSGYAKAGVGGAFYVSSANTGATAWRAQSANGRWFELASDEIPTPAKFGAPLDGTDSDLPAIQAAVSYVQTVRGRGQVHLEDRTYHCPSGTLTVDPTLCGLLGRGAKLDFGGRTTTNPASMPELNPDPTFASATGWLTGTLSEGVHPWVISGNAATHTIPDAGPSNQGYYDDFGRQMPGVQASTTYTATFTVASISNGGSNQTYVELRVLDGSGGPANNGLGYGAGLAYTVNAAGAYTIVFTTPATIPAGGAWVGFQTNNNVSITSLSIKQVPNNTLLLVQSQASSPAYGHEPFSWGNFEIAGPGKTSYAVAIEFNTLASNGPSTRGQYYNIAIHDVNVGMSFENQTYCLDFYGCSIWNTQTCVSVQAVTTNAGEEVCFHSCKLFNSTLAINNPAYELVLFGGSLDYCLQWYVGGGVATFNDVHFEKQQPSGATNYPFDLSGSCDVVIRGGTLLVTQTGPNNYFFNTSDKFSRIVLDNVKGYGWPAASGQLLGGPGQLIVDGRILWGANHQIASQISANSAQNLYGSAGTFEGSSIGVMTWIDQGVGTTRIGSTSVSAITGTGNGTISKVYAPAPLIPGGWKVSFSSATAFTVTKPSGQVDGTGAVGALYIGGIQFLVTAGSTPFAAGSSFTITVSGLLRYGAGWQNADGSIYASSSLSLSSAQAYAGTQSLQFLKTGVGGGTGAGFHLACDFKPGAQAAQQFQYKIPPIPGASAGNVTLWADSNFAKLLGFDSQGLPVLGSDMVFFGETAITFDPTVGAGWSLASAGTLYADESSPSNGIAPDWCNCIVFGFNTVSMPSGFAMYIDALGAWQFGG
jgi:hypothetical protein